MEGAGDTNESPSSEAPRVVGIAPPLVGIAPPLLVGAVQVCGSAIENATQKTSNIGEPGVVQLGSSTGSPRAGTSGRTIHHHGQSPTSGGLPPLANANPAPHTTPSSSKHSTPDSHDSVIGRVLSETKKMSELASAMGGASPAKRPKLDEAPPCKVTDHRSRILMYKMSRLRRARAVYVEHLTEMFFLQNGGNLMDYFTWKKRPTPQLVQFLRTGTQNCDEDDDLSKPLKSPEITRVPSLAGSPSTTTPVATSTQLPPSVTSLVQHGDSKKTVGGRHGMVFGHVQSNQHLHTQPTAITQPGGISITPSTTAYTGGEAVSTTTLTTVSQASGEMSSVTTTTVKTTIGAPKSPKAGSANRLSKQPSLYDLCTGNLGTQQAIVERARQEAQVMQRVAELRKDGLWTSRRLPKVQEPSRNKAHWDYLLEEMQWLAADFCQERKWKKAGSRKISRMVLKYHQELQQKELRAEKEEVSKLKKIASSLAKQVKQFWTNVEKVVEYKQQSRLDERRKKALDLHLNFIVDQTEKYSSWLTEGLASTGPTPKSSHPSSLVSKVSELDSSFEADDEFLPQGSDDGADDEETIDMEEKEGGTEDPQDEITALHNDSQMPFDELLRSLPAEILETPAPLPPPSPPPVPSPGQGEIGDAHVDAEKKSSTSKHDSDFDVEGDDVVDVDDTIDEEEENEDPDDTTAEINDLEEEGNLTMEELLEKYAGAYDSDFEFEADESGSDGDEDMDESEEEKSTASEEDEVEEDGEEGEVDVESQEDMGLEYLMEQGGAGHVAQASTATEQLEDDGPGKEITDIAAEAMALQPKGYTLQTTEVKTAIPFLIRHTLREYQHVGLDWLATMYDQRLNGILADEMGLGKTIQTIALIAHLACKHEIWGPHLIIVPTSVMLNWELEFKKWCPAFKILTYYGTQKERKLKRTGWTKTNAFHVCITSYKLVIQDHTSFKRKKWKYLVLDEAQNIKNFKSQRWQTLLNFQSQRRLLLTGTPLQNSLMELWSLMHFLMPHVFQSHREFKEWFANPLTGMVEGNHDYNEGLIRRLHKVLRPFLLRRLKVDVEKQMPKKYEHVVMCHLSKRQRFLYDDFMSQRKTKETLATGHFMSVINILMQLRKVCNHPNLFDPRPIVSPFQTEGISISVPSLAVRALEYDPLRDIDVYAAFPNLCELEQDLPAFIAHRVRRLQTPRTLITQIDHVDLPPDRPPVTTKPLVLRGVSPSLQSASGQSSPASGSSRSSTPLSLIDHKSLVQPSVAPLPGKGDKPMVTYASLHVPLSVVKSVPPRIMSPLVAVPSPPSAATLTKSLPFTTHGILPVVASSVVTPKLVSSQPITVQIQHTDHGTRLMFPSSQLSQLPPSFIHIVQTSSGQQIIATTNPTSINSNPLFLTPSTSLSYSTLPTTSITTTPNTTTPATSQQQLATTATSVTPMITSTPLPSLIMPGSLGVQDIKVTVTRPAVSNLVAPLADWTTPIFQPLTTPAKAVVTAPPRATAISVVAPIVNGTAPTSVTSLLNPTPTVTIARPLTVKTTTPSIQLPYSTSFATTFKPVMKVLPLVTVINTMPTTTLSVTTMTTITSTGSMPVLTTKVFDQPMPSPVIVTKPKPKPKSPFYIESLDEKRDAARHSKLATIARVNRERCGRRPTYGSDLHHVVDTRRSVSRAHWSWMGHAACQVAHECRGAPPPAYFMVTQALCDLIKTPLDQLAHLEPLLDRYAFVTPRVMSPVITMNVPHPAPSQTNRLRHMQHTLHEQLTPQLKCLHKISASMTVQFPELRLIQYDCGKLQTMDILLTRLKSGHHRVLIFTQMTKMLNVLEAFLNYHGHRYLRLDGTTKVEQRQALMDRFNADKRIFCFILSTRSGGIGVNLTGADTVIFYDSDWNPTMDAQAQDRCHRIGQTRDVHIYRLISEMTIEENILKKANQKRLLGDLAIEGGNFTMAHLKTQTIKDLFDEPVGLESMNKAVGGGKEKAGTPMDTGVQDKEVVQEMTDDSQKGDSRVTAGGQKEEVTASELKVESHEVTASSQKVEVVGDVQRKFEEALCKAEDETDVIAARQVRAEQKAELAEFDETIPWDEKEAERRKEEEDVSKVEVELAQLEKELSPIERYAVTYLELEIDPTEMDEFLNAEEEIETAKKEWELSRLKSLKEEEERRAELEEDEMLFTYGRTSAYHQDYISDITGAKMPLWAPPTPPQDDNDIYMDQSLLFLYDTAGVMSESQLPPVHIRKEVKRPKIETVTTRKQKQRKEEQPRPPRSLFERPTAALLKIRKEAKLAKLKQGGKPFRPSPVLGKPVLEFSLDQPEWLVHEDWSLLQAVQKLQDLTVNLTIVSPAHIPNWDLVCDVVNAVSRIYRSPKQCKSRYENVVIPREEGRVMLDDPKRPKKNKSIYKANRPMRTGQLYITDDNKSSTMLFSLRFDAMRNLGAKRKPTLRQTLANPTQKNPKHAAVLQESGIKYDQPLTPVEVAAIRADRIQREKKNNQAAAEQLRIQTSTVAGAVSGSVAPTVQTIAGIVQARPNTSTTTAMSVTSQKMTVGQQGVAAIAISRQVAANNIILNTTPVCGAPSFSAINKRISQSVSQPTSVTMSSAISQAMRAQRVITGVPATITVQDLAASQQNRATLQTTTASVLTSAALTAAQLAAAHKSLVGVSTAVAGTTAVQQHTAGLPQTTMATMTTKGLTAAQLTRVVQQQTLLKQQHTLQQKHLLHAQKLGITPEQLRQRLQQGQQNTAAQVLAAAGQKAVISSQLVTAVGQKGAATAQIKKGSIPTDIQVLLKHKQFQQQQKAGTPAQIIAQAQMMSQSGSVSHSPVATLVKTVTTHTGTLPSVAIPISQVGPVSISMSLAQQKGKTQVSQLQQLQLQQQLQRKAQLQAVGKVTGQGVVTGKTQLPLIIQQKSAATVTVQQFQQLMKQQAAVVAAQHGGAGGAVSAAAFHQILSSVNAATTTQPTIIATVTQTQPQIVSKVTFTTTSSPLHTLSHTPTISLTQVPSTTHSVTHSNTGHVIPPNVQVQAIAVTGQPSSHTLTAAKFTSISASPSLQQQLVSQIRNAAAAGQAIITTGQTGRLTTQPGMQVTPLQVRNAAQAIHVTPSRVTTPVVVSSPVVRTSTDPKPTIISITTTPSTQHRATTHHIHPPTPGITVASIAMPHTVPQITAVKITAATTSAGSPHISVAPVVASLSVVTTPPVATTTVDVVSTPVTVTMETTPSSPVVTDSPTSTTRTPYSMRLRNMQK